MEQFSPEKGPWALVGEHERAFEPFMELPKVTRLHDLVESVDFDGQTVHVTGRVLQYDFLHIIIHFNDHLHSYFPDIINTQSLVISRSKQ